MLSSLLTSLAILTLTYPISYFQQAERVRKSRELIKIDRSGDFKVYGPWMVAQRRYRRNSAAKQTSNAKESAWGSYSIVNSHHKAATGSRFEVLSGGINGACPIAEWLKGRL
ncbi:hypothetical protein Salmi_Mp088 (mitochondrion) [Salvia miltiorrhiza]|uniref:Uncharacterized protein n=1 Tax=Salvia miltiorrhiza TaxID=226208 RepID=V9P501_SALMI|nr:hypothetical protein Salmi_Mp088 [Salvia miltiorrhiza]AGU16616.1 hypothetical protein Salmi_Mp088 [Salvia miltiorrhiza]